MSSLKRLLVAFTILLATTATMAQNGFNYQAVIRDAKGNLVANHESADYYIFATVCLYSPYAWRDVLNDNIAVGEWGVAILLGGETNF